MKSQYPLPCAACGLHLPLDKNGRCADCNRERGLRRCRGACGELLPIEVCFYPNKARCKDCLRAEKAGKKITQR